MMRPRYPMKHHSEETHFWRDLVLNHPPLKFPESRALRLFHFDLKAFAAAWKPDTSGRLASQETLGHKTCKFTACGEGHDLCYLKWHEHQGTANKCKQQVFVTDLVESQIYDYLLPWTSRIEGYSDSWFPFLLAQALRDRSSKVARSAWHKEFTTRHAGTQHSVSTAMLKIR